MRCLSKWVLGAIAFGLVGGCGRGKETGLCSGLDAVRKGENSIGYLDKAAVRLKLWLAKKQQSLAGTGGGGGLVWSFLWFGQCSYFV